jgi:hypothetical protein
VSGQPILPRCNVCRQRLLCVDGPEVAPIGATRIVRVDRQTGTVTVVCVCGQVRDWEMPRTASSAR